MDPTNPNKKFADLCKVYCEETKHFCEAAKNFFEHQKNSSIEKKNVLLNSANLLINSERVGICAELNIKNQKLSFTNASLKKNNSSLFKIVKLYESLTNVIITRKPVETENEEAYLGEFHAKGLKKDEDSCSKSKEKVTFFQIKRKTDGKKEQKWKLVPLKKGDKKEHYEDLWQYYEKCLNSIAY